jgi:hypothetical protein
VLDINDLANPRNIGRVRLPGTIAQNGVVQGSCVYVADGTNGLQIIPTQCQGARFELEARGVEFRSSMASRHSRTPRARERI